MADVFLNSAYFENHTFSTLTPPNSFALNLKALIKVSKVSWTSQLLYEILRSSLEKNFDKKNFISPNKLLSKAWVLYGELLQKLSNSEKTFGLYFRSVNITTKLSALWQWCSAVHFLRELLHQQMKIEWWSHIKVTIFPS